ncbi:response regulator, partial [Rhodoplanes elegans]
MALAVTSTSRASTATGDRVRVMVVDDSVVVRGLISRWLEEQPDFEVVASLRTGQEAVDQVEKLDPDVAILDIEMPVLDGISALPLLLAKKRDLVVIMASTLTLKNAEVSLKALSLGAADYIPKPETARGVTTSADFKRDLVEKVRQLGQRRRRMRGPRPAT